MQVHYIKGVIVGDSQVGKNSLFNKLVSEQPNILCINDQFAKATYKITLEINPNELDNSYPCYLFLFDVTRKSTYAYLQNKQSYAFIIYNESYWDTVLPHIQKNFQFVTLIGNKADITEREIAQEKVDAQAKADQITYLEISLKTGKFIDRLLASLKMKSKQYISKLAQGQQIIVYKPVPAMSESNESDYYSEEEQTIPNNQPQSNNIVIYSPNTPNHRESFEQPVTKKSVTQLPQTPQPDKKFSTSKDYSNRVSQKQSIMENNEQKSQNGINQEVTGKKISTFDSNYIFKTQSPQENMIQKPIQEPSKFQQKQQEIAIQEKLHKQSKQYEIPTSTYEPQKEISQKEIYNDPVKINQQKVNNFQYPQIINDYPQSNRDSFKQIQKQDSVVKPFDSYETSEDPRSKTKSQAHPQIDSQRSEQSQIQTPSTIKELAKSYVGTITENALQQTQQEAKNLIYTPKINESEQIGNETQTTSSLNKIQTDIRTLEQKYRSMTPTYQARKTSTSPSTFKNSSPNQRAQSRNNFDQIKQQITHKYGQSEFKDKERNNHHFLSEIHKNLDEIKLTILRMDQNRKQQHENLGIFEEPMNQTNYVPQIIKNYFQQIDEISEKYNDSHQMEKKQNLTQQWQRFEQRNLSQMNYLNKNIHHLKSSLAEQDQLISNQHYQEYFKMLKQQNQNNQLPQQKVLNEKLKINFIERNKLLISTVKLPKDKNKQMQITTNFNENQKKIKQKNPKSDSKLYKVFY